MMDKLGDRLTLHLNAPVQKVVRHDRGVDIEREGVTHTFDQVIFACHSAQALAMLASPTQAEREVLGDIGWQRNEVVLHSDPRWLPVRKRAWASWNYRLSEQDRASACVTYNMNILQGLPPGSPLFCVTLNPETPVEERYVLRRFVYEHPLLTRKAGKPGPTRRNKRSPAELVLRRVLVQRLPRRWRTQCAGRGKRYRGRGGQLR